MYRTLGKVPPVSKRLIASYVLDWVIILATAGAGLALGRFEPHKRHFSLMDPTISFPYTEKELVPIWLAGVISGGMPILLVILVSLIFVPGPTVPVGTPKAVVWRRKLWELHVGLLGLGLSLATALFFTEATKNIFGKPRPDMLSRCQPDIENWKNYIVGGYELGSMDGRVVSAAICQQTDTKKLDDGFRSYPSGHSSTAAAGLLYLSLFLASKLSVRIPFAMPSASALSRADAYAAFPVSERKATSPEPYEPLAKPAGKAFHAFRSQAASPPLYLLFLITVPFSVGVFIAASRWYDYRHHGFDILFGFTMGAILAIYSFRFYHTPISAGAGWAWGPRSHRHAFWSGIGLFGYRSNAGEVHQQQQYSEVSGRDMTELRGPTPDIEANLSADRARNDYELQQMRHQQQDTGFDFGTHPTTQSNRI
ncbi:hypothetical protein V2G26_009472 [Clonostachys chloroleuca]|uniref:Phosphatidic acid phosphatase type 2/haloperoxidase domain-containing protein n=1 Tax=Clonostachys chloroleuca TaxID=1926264 RepID=A0AA35M876_9HYPO|nr:unnamed protein product [Clonostachys chloroleuca]